MNQNMNMNMNTNPSMNNGMMMNGGMGNMGQMGNNQPMQPNHMQQNQQRQVRTSIFFLVLFFSLKIKLWLILRLDGESAYGSRELPPNTGVPKLANDEPARSVGADTDEHEWWSESVNVEPAQQPLGYARGRPHVQRQRHQQLQADNWQAVVFRSKPETIGPHCPEFTPPTQTPTYTRTSIVILRFKKHRPF